MPGAIDFIEDSFEVQINRETAILTWPCGMRRAIPLDVFRMDHMRAGRALAEYDARRAEVIEFPRKHG